MHLIRRVLVCALLTSGALAALVSLDRLFPPPLARLEDLSTVVLDREGELLRAFATSEGSWRLPITPDAVDPLYLALLLAIEDRRFFFHPGVDPLALARALFQLLRYGRVISGGSTLTMQLARLLEPRPRTLSAKFLEMARALQLEWHLGKAGVLAAYLTLVPMGGNLEGVRAASLAWFGHEPRVLSPAEAALLVALPQAPTRLRPDRFPERAQAARDRVLERGRAFGILDEADVRAARAAPIPRVRRPLPFHAPHLAERRARAAPAGAVVRTTVDGALQRALERLARSELDRLPPPVDLAILVVEHGSGRVRAWVGAGDWNDPHRLSKLDLVRAVRSPGSTLKPFVYGLAFDAGIAHPNTLVRDEARRFEDYSPRNFDGGFVGDVSLRTALVASLNLPAVLLAERLGPNVIAERLAAAGVQLVFARSHATAGLPLVLGGVGTRLFDLVAAYGALARDGSLRPLTDDPAAPQPEPLPLLAPESAAVLAAILAEAPRPAGMPPGTRRIAYKTGTSHRLRDGWAIGFDGGHVVGVWVGRADGAFCAVCNGPGTAAPILFRVLALLPEVPLVLPPPRDPLLGPSPPALARLAPRPLAQAPERGRGPRITFPVEGSVIVVEPGQALPLRASGGQPPYRWLVDGHPLPARARSHPLWMPDDDGFAQLRVVDAAGRSDTVTVTVARRVVQPALSPTSPSRTRPAP